MWSCNITFIGSRKDITTILGGFGIDEQENITFKNMTVTNTTGPAGGSHRDGILMINANVELFDVTLNGYGNCALNLSNSISENTLVATRCEFAYNYCGAAVIGSL